MGRESYRRSTSNDNAYRHLWSPGKSWRSTHYALHGVMFIVWNLTIPYVNKEGMDLVLREALERPHKKDLEIAVDGLSRLTKKLLHFRCFCRAPSIRIVPLGQKEWSLTPVLIVENLLHLRLEKVRKKHPLSWADVISLFPYSYFSFLRRASD